LPWRRWNTGAGELDQSPDLMFREARIVIKHSALTGAPRGRFDDASDPLPGNADPFFAEERHLSDKFRTARNWSDAASFVQRQSSVPAFTTLARTLVEQPAFAGTMTNVFSAGSICRLSGPRFRCHPTSTPSAVGLPAA